MPKVSIVLPTYNGEQYIRESIESIMNQTYTDWELIIVNDCSADSTPSIIDEYAKKDNRIRIVNNEVNRKLPASLNIGFSNAKGEYLTWTSDDNRYLPNALETMAAYLDANRDSMMVNADMNLIDADGKQTEFYDSNTQKLYMVNTVGACFLYRKEVLTEIGGYDEGLFCVEDYDYWLKIAERYQCIEHISEILYEYRRHEANLSSKKREFIAAQRVKLQRKHWEYMESHMLPEDATVFYWDFIKEKDYELRSRIIKKFQYLESDRMNARNNNKFVIFGAGEYGRKAQRELQDNALFFVDNASEKIGQQINGLQVKSVDSLYHLPAGCAIMIAVGAEKIYTIMSQLNRMGVGNYCTYQSYMDVMKGTHCMTE